MIRGIDDIRGYLIIPTAIISLFGSMYLAGAFLRWLGVGLSEPDNAAYLFQFGSIMAFSILVSYLATNAMEGNFSVSLGNFLGLIFSLVFLLVLIGGLYFLWSAVPVWAFFIIILLTLILLVLFLIYLKHTN